MCISVTSLISLQILSILSATSASLYCVLYRRQDLDRTQTPSDPGQERFLLKRILLKKLDLLFLPESKRSKISEAESSFSHSLAVRKSILILIITQNQGCWVFLLFCFDILTFRKVPFLFLLFLLIAKVGSNSIPNLRVSHVGIHPSGRMQINQCKLIISIGKTIKSKV